MSVVKKIQLPDNTIVDINDNRIKRYTNATGTAAVSADPPYTHAKWDVTDASITAYYDGLVVSLVVPVTGHDTFGTAFQINSLGYKPVVFDDNDGIGDRHTAGSTIWMVYNPTQTSTLYMNSSTATTVTGCWQSVEGNPGNVVYTGLDESQGDIIDSATGQQVDIKQYAKKEWVEDQEYLTLETLPPDLGVQSDWNETDSESKAFIKNKPTIPQPPTIGTLSTTSASAQSTSASESFSNAITLHKISKTGSYNDLLNKPTIPAAPGTLNTNISTAQSVSSSEALSGSISLHKIAKTGSYNDLLNKPNFATVATSGSYTDLDNKPTIPAAPGTLNTNNTTAQTVSSSEALSGSISLHKIAKTGSYGDLLNTPSFATVATSGSYTDLDNKPTIPTVNNATLTIQKNGTQVATFTANASSNVTANITIPTTVSSFTNDAGYITADQALPPVTAADNGKFLIVTNGSWQIQELHTNVYFTGNTTPSQALGDNGDLYLQTL